MEAKDGGAEGRKTDEFLGKNLNCQKIKNSTQQFLRPYENCIVER